MSEIEQASYKGDGSDNKVEHMPTVHTKYLEPDSREYEHNMTEGGNAAFHNYLNDFAHIEDPLERRRLALEKIDETAFGWLQVKTIMIAGVGFLTDSYDIFAINLGISMMSYVFWEGNMPASTSTLLKVSTSVGTVVGQVSFGCAADVLGRKKIYGTELIIVICAAIFQCTIGTAPGINFVGVLTFYRIVMGIGIGGDYPLSSIITSEFSTTKWRGAIMGAVFANQAWGQIMAGIVSLVVVAAYKSEIEHANSGKECDFKCRKACDQMWRILVGFGAVPGMLALYYRLTIPESPRYALDVETELNAAESSGSSKVHNIDIQYDGKEDNSAHFDVEKGPAPEPVIPKASFRDFWRHFGQWKYFKILLGTAGSWFMVDIAFYGLSLNTAVILQAINYAGSSNIYKKLWDSCVGNLILICAGSLPGYWVSVATMDIIGRKPIQIMGFIMLTIWFCVIGFAYHKIPPNGLLGLYIICEFFSNFGPNVTTFIVPGECFPTRYRSSAHGISAASGKVGAIIAQTVLGNLINHDCAKNGKKKNCWLPHVMEIFALFMLVGIFTSFLIPETTRMTLEEISEKYHDEIDPSKLAARRNMEIEAESQGSSSETPMEEPKKKTLLQKFTFRN